MYCLQIILFFSVLTAGNTFSVDVISTIIQEVKKRYTTIATLLIESEYPEEWEKRGLQAIMKLCWAESIQVASVHIQEIRTIKTPGRPLYVIPYPDDAIVNNLQKVIHLQELSNAKWLLFLKSSLEELLKNIFIPLDIEFLVVQNTQSISITEFYHIPSSQPTQRHLMANWSKESGISWQNTTFYGRRTNLQNVIITVSLIQQPPYLYCDQTCEYTYRGFVVDLWKLLQTNLNFTTRYILPYDGWYGDRDKNGTWNGVIGMLVNSDADVGLNVLDYEPLRLNVVDYLPPLWNLKKMLHIKQPGLETFQAQQMLQPFSQKIWWIVLFVILVITSVLWGTWRIKSRMTKYQENETYSLYNSLFYVLGIFTKQSICISPRTWPCRLVLLSAGFSSMLVLFAYFDTFITHLTIQKITIPFSDFRGLLEDGTYKVGMTGSIQENYFMKSKDPVLNKIYKKNIEPYRNSTPKTVNKGLMKICKENKYGFIASDIIFLGIERELPCNIFAVPYAYYSKAVSLVIEKYSPFKRIFDHNIQELRRNGILKHLMAKTWPPKLKEILKEPPPAVTMEMVFTIFIILVVGEATAVLILMMEFFIYYVTFGKNSVKKKQPILQFVN